MAPATASRGTRTPPPVVVGQCQNPLTAQSFERGSVRFVGGPSLDLHGLRVSRTSVDDREERLVRQLLSARSRFQLLNPTRRLLRRPLGDRRPATHDGWVLVVERALAVLPPLAGGSSSHERERRKTARRSALSDVLRPVHRSGNGRSLQERPSRRGRGASWPAHVACSPAGAGQKKAAIDRGRFDSDAERT